MGITDFYKIKLSDGKTVKDLGHCHDLSFMNGKSVAVDAMRTVFSSYYAIKHHGLGTDGQETGHIVVVFNVVMKLFKQNVGQIWVFDGAVNELKRETVERRTNKLPPHAVDDIKRLLQLIGVPWYVVNVEAEFYCAELMRAGAVDYVYTNDSDTILKGADIMYEETVDRRKVLYTLRAKDVYDAMGVTPEDMARIAVIMGCDYCLKTVGVGPATILKRYRTIVLTELQQRAYEELLKPTNLKTAIMEQQAGKRNILGLKSWLRDLKFSDRTLDKLNVLM